MNIEAFTGRAQDYIEARPAYPIEAVEYIYNLASSNAVFADIGAGTGKFTELLARYGNELFAVEPNADMLKQLAITLAPFSNTKIFNGSAEATKLPDHSVDVIINAQSLRRFDIEAFRIECNRIGKAKPIVVTLHNTETPYRISHFNNPKGYYKSVAELYRNPIVMEFPNPIYFTLDKWLSYFISMEGVPQDYNSEFIIEKKKIFERDNVDGVLHHDLITVVYSERLE